MIEELKVLQDILGDMSGVGLWMAAGFFILKLAEILSYVYVIYFICTKIAEAVHKYSLQGVDLANSLNNHEALKKSYANDLKRETQTVVMEAVSLKEGYAMDVETYKSDIKILKRDHESKLNEIKAAYKILKES